jgi:hypothetical protein
MGDNHGNHRPLFQMILRVVFHDAHMPKVLNLLSDKEFTPLEKSLMKKEAYKLLKDKNMEYEKRQFDVVVK